MARLARLAVADHAHLVLLRGHSGHPVFGDDVDRSAFLTALQHACEAERVALHAYALLDDHVWLLCTPASAQAVGRALQALGRRFSAGLNRRHGRSGGVWDGRYRATVVEGGAALLEAMVFVDQAPTREGSLPDALSTAWSSARQHAGLGAELPLTDAPGYWALGNTPFDRCAAYRALLEEPLGNERAARLTAAVHRGWPVGSPAFLDVLHRMSPRRVEPRPRGRPRKVAT
ncbi:MAG TPA: transposase [Burkholderiaceae bacterium]